MRFVPNGPDVPDALVAAQERGEVLFVCGAGVSHAAGLPLFRGLVEGVYQDLGESWTAHLDENAAMDTNAYDRVLRALERRLAATATGPGEGMRARIRTAVQNRLQPADGADLTDHLALIELSRDAEGRNRILTTNFDTLFERAWLQRGQGPIESHASAAMPQPRTAACTGVLHIHGRIADERLQLSETELVLTSAEFGDAYLRSGWASRYVYDLVRAYTLVLVG
jgi:NAD-dependent SIR2 family protein deacetylase